MTVKKELTSTTARGSSWVELAPKLLLLGKEPVQRMLLPVPPLYLWSGRQAALTRTQLQRAWQVHPKSPLRSSASVSVEWESEMKAPAEHWSPLGQALWPEKLWHQTALSNLMLLQGSPRSAE